ncbi:MAG: hypothetical protein AB7O96_05655 [Pseudobdellovibrionaceae bacterium]
MKTENILLALCLTMTAVVSIATSQAPSSGRTATKSAAGAASNCPGAILTNQQIVATSYGTITDPADIDFTFFGLPEEVVVIGQTSVSGLVNGVTRTCVHSVDTTSGTMHVYTCSENDAVVCEVTFTAL